MCLTIAPALAAGPATRIVEGPRPPEPRGLVLDHVMADDEGFLFLRYTACPVGQWRFGAVRFVNRVSSRSKSDRSSKPL